MFSEKALAKFNERGFSLTSTLLFLSDSLRESVAVARARPRIALRVWLFSTLFHAGVTLIAASGYAGEGPQFARFVGYVAAGYGGFTALLILNFRLLHDRSGAPASGFGLANTLTAIRFYLIVPVVVLFAHGHAVMAVAFYLVLGLTDVADGLVARVRGEETQFGVLMDPLADVFSTFALFTLFFSLDIVPLWLYLLLVLRYGQLIVGSFVLFLARGPIRWHATLPGKVAMAGTVAGVSVIALSVGLDWDGWPAIKPALFGTLGVMFAWVIANQAWLGYRHLRRSGSGNEQGGRGWTSKAI